MANIPVNNVEVDTEEFRGDQGNGDQSDGSSSGEFPDTSAAYNDASDLMREYIDLRFEDFCSDRNLKVRLSEEKKQLEEQLHATQLKIGDQKKEFQEKLETQLKEKDERIRSLEGDILKLKANITNNPTPILIDSHSDPLAFSDQVDLIILEGEDDFMQPFNLTLESLEENVIVIESIGEPGDKLLEGDDFTRSFKSVADSNATGSGSNEAEIGRMDLENDGSGTKGEKCATDTGTQEISPSTSTGGSRRLPSKRRRRGAKSSTATTSARKRLRSNKGGRRK